MFSASKLTSRSFKVSMKSKMRFLCLLGFLTLILAIAPKPALAAVAPLLNQPGVTNYSAPVPGGAANTTKITFFSPIGISGATKWQVKVQDGAFAPPDLDSTVSGAVNYTVNTDIPVLVTYVVPHLLLLATDDNDKIKAYDDIDISGANIVSQAAALLSGGGAAPGYSDPVPGSAIGTTKIGTLNLPGLATKWQYAVRSSAFIPAADGTYAGSLSYTAGDNIPIAANKHLLLMATDDAGTIKGYADIIVQAGWIEPAANMLAAGTDYSVPVPGLTPGTTRVVTLNLSGIAGAVKWQYKVQSSSFATPPLNSTLSGASDYTVNTDITVTEDQHLMLLATDIGGGIKGYADVIINSGQINNNNMSLTTPTNYSTPVPGSAAGNTKIETLNFSGILGATKWQYAVQANPFAAPAYDSTFSTLVVGAADYTANSDILANGNHLVLAATDAAGKIKAYTDITISADCIRPVDLTAISSGGTNYSDPVPGGAGGNTKIVTLILPGIATKWQYVVQTGPFSVPGVDTMLPGASDYKAGADISIMEDQHLMLLATDNSGKIKGFVDLPVTAGQISNTTAAEPLSTPANYSVPVPGATPGKTKISNLSLSGTGATKWRLAVQAGPYTTPVLNSDSTAIAGIADYTSGTDFPAGQNQVTPGQHLILLATDNSNQIKAFADITLVSSEISAYSLNTLANNIPVPGTAGGTTQITNLFYNDINAIINGGTAPATKWQYSIQTGALDILPVLDSQASATSYTSGADIPVTAGQHLILLATDDAGQIKAFADIPIVSSQISASALMSPANYSTPVPGSAAGSTKIATLNLPSNSGATKWQYIVQAGAVTPALDTNLAGTTYTAGADIAITTGQHLILLATDALGKIKAFKDIAIAQNQINCAALLKTDFTNGDDIVAGNKTITVDLTLTDYTWATDAATSQAKRNLLFDNMTASGSDSAEWAKVIGSLKVAANPVNLSANFKVLTITLPATPTFNITSDQIITVEVPSSLFQISGNVTLVPSAFTIKMNRNVTITGTITSASTTADIRKGGKTVILTLKNLPGSDTWDTNIVLDTTKRQALISSLVASGAEAAKWNNDVIEALKASATVIRTNDTMLTITLPPVPTYNITGSQTIQLSNVPGACLASGNSFTVPSPASSFTITPAGATAAATGTIMGSNASPTSEANIVAGGNTIVYTLTNDTWAYDIATNSSKYSLLFGGLTLSSPATDEANMWASVKTALNAGGSIVRTSNTVVTVTLPAVSNYHITAAQTITPTIPSLLVNSGESPVMASTFTINPVTADVSGTIVDTATTQDKIVSGGSTIVITLKNDIWAPDVVTNSTKVNLLINGITASPMDAEWQKVRTALKANTGKIKVSGAVLTITLPAVSDYYIAADQTITVNIDKSLLKQPAAVNIIATPAFTVFVSTPPPATATVTFSPDLDVANVRAGTAAVVITLNNGTWVSDIATNKNKLNTLIDGFTADTDASQWELVKTMIKATSTIITNVLNLSGSQLTITLPAVGSYNVSADQVINIKIPKALVNQAKADLTAAPSFTIKALVIGTLDALLQDGGLDTLLTNYSPNNIYVVVPKKYINKINLSTNKIGTKSYTVIDVEAESEVNAVQAACGDMVRTSTTFTLTSGKHAFSLAFPDLEIDADVTMSAFSDTLCTTKLCKDVTVKVAEGSTAPYPPKGAASKSLAGSYSIQKLISDSTTFNNILLQYGLDELSVIAPN